MALVPLLTVIALSGFHSSQTVDVSRFHFEDVERFVVAYEKGRTGDLAAALQEGYIDPGSSGVRGFLPNRIQNAQTLAETIAKRPERYTGLMEKAAEIRKQIPAMVAAMENLKRRYPAAQIPDVWFVVGRLNSGGTSTRDGLILGIEHEANDPSSIVPLVAHELVHFQQKGFPRNILERSIKEGSADFVGELICGRLTPHAANTMRLARPREREFWDAFRKDMEGFIGQDRWLFNYGKGTDAWPSDLGYWFGYEICRAYWDRALDQRRALGEILEVVDYRAFFEKSGYANRPKRDGVRTQDDELPPAGFWD